jgi:YjbE family integral membrane protein
VFESLSAIVSIIIIDLVLSGDNAVVIGMAARNLSPENRRRAIIFGGAGAIGLRVLFTAMATLLLGIPGLQAIGGVLLIWIAYRLIRPQGNAHGNIQEAGTLGEAIRTIILADVVMSLDNILAVAGAAHGDVRLLMFGLLLSIPILLFGSELVARLIGRFPAFLYIGAYVLVHAAVAMFFHDPTIAGTVQIATWQELVLSLALTGVIVGFVRWLEQVRARRAASARGTANGYERLQDVPTVAEAVAVEADVAAGPPDESGRRVTT